MKPPPEYNLTEAYHFADEDEESQKSDPLSPSISQFVDVTARASHGWTSATSVHGKWEGNPIGVSVHHLLSVRDPDQIPSYYFP